MSDNVSNPVNEPNATTGSHALPPDKSAESSPVVPVTYPSRGAHAADPAVPPAPAGVLPPPPDAGVAVPPAPAGVLPPPPDAGVAVPPAPAGVLPPPPDAGVGIPPAPAGVLPPPPDAGVGVPPAPGGMMPPPPIQSADSAAPLGLSRPGQRRRPRFVERPKSPDDDPVLNRRNLLSSTRTSGDKPQFSRERVIAGNLPDWDPLPPGEMLISRS